MDRPSSLGRRRGYPFGVYLRKELFLKWTIWIIYFLQLTTALDPQNRLISGCYGDSITISCLDADEVIIVNSLKVGSKPKGFNCTINRSANGCCTMDSDNDCIFDYESKVSSDKHEFRLCQGKQRECPMKVMWAQNNGKCSSAKYNSTTNYMVANYTCAKKNHMMDMCGPSGSSTIISDTTIHLRNYLYPNFVQNSRNCLCNITTLNNQRSHTLRVEAVDVLFNCSQSLAFSDQTILKKVTCEKALYGLSTIYASEGTKPEIHMRYQTANESSIFLWVEVSVDEPENNRIQVTCRNMSEEYRMPVELSETTDSDSSTSKGTDSTIHTATQQITASASSSSSYLEEKGGIALNDPRLIGGVTAGLLLAATLAIVLIFVWKRKRKESGGAQPLRYSTDTNPYDNFSDNAAFEEAIYDTIPDNLGSSGKAALSDNSQTDSAQNHAYESLKSNGSVQFPNIKDGTNGSASGSDTSLPKEPAPLPPTPDLFRRLPSLPKEESDTPNKSAPAEKFNVINETTSVPEEPFLESARTSTQTMLETLTASDPDLSSRESLPNVLYSLSKSDPRSKQTEPKVSEIDENGTKEKAKGLNTEMDTEAENKTTSADKSASSSSSSTGKVIPGPAIYHDTE